MSIRRTKTKGGKFRYSPRVHTGGGKYQVLGTYPTREKAREVEAQWLLSKRSQRTRSVGEYVDFYLEGYRERTKTSSYQTAASALATFKADFGTRSLASLDPTEAEEWARDNRWTVPAIVTMLNYAVAKQVVSHNVFAGLSRKGPGRRHNEPLSVTDVAQLAATAKRKHGQAIASFVLFTAYSGMRVGEVFALQWSDIDFETNRIQVKRRVYRGELDLPKANKARTIVLPPAARDALLPLDRSTDWIFYGKRGGRLSQSSMTYYWQGITGDRKVAMHELRHFAGHYLYVTLGLPARVVAAQLGHSGPRLVEELYGHGDHGALEELDRAFATTNVFPLRRASGE